ncbi:hypothetical protein L596_011434 [Steinernema carpocapsae]|uniref:Hydroxymethylglutaryl-CoA synthase n=1 Tax=Steinernema carpocapsae TaxID=34508 RepID=A0A4U5NUD3_STECR|nr:hypothetical protein L596_011434 [Steinernema carpocapsae]
MSGMSRTLPEDVGILGIEFYFPGNYVSQTRLAEYMKVKPEKHTIGLGQDEMGFCGDNEDVNSLALTVTQRLLETYQIDQKKIGFLAVGTESETDKSKSVKTYLMDLFASSGNHNIRGVDVKNACYGGTEALLTAIDWVRSNGFKNKWAIAVMSDIAVYEEGPARPTGGAGAIAILVGPNAPVVYCPATGVYMANNNDFCKPLKPKNTEYPTVNGQTSVQAYVGALDECYKTMKEEMKEYCSEDISLKSFYSVFFHSPFTRLVEKAFGRLALTDFAEGKFEVNEADLEKLSQYEKSELMDLKKYLTDRDLWTFWLKVTENEWTSKTLDYLAFNKRVGNMYTPSLYAQLVALFARLPENFEQHRVLLFSYGSGSASAMFSFKITPGEALDRMRQVGKEVLERLDERCEFSPEDYSAILKTREVMLATEAPKEPNTDWSPKLKLFPGTYYLTGVDAQYCRKYKRFLSVENGFVQNGHYQD